MNDILIIDTTVHYFSYATTASVPDPVTGFHVPDKHLSWTNYPLCWFMGRNFVDMGNGKSTDSTWFENDGTVNTVSMMRPFTGNNGPEPMKVFSSSEPIEAGVWNIMGKYERLIIYGFVFVFFPGLVLFSPFLNLRMNGQEEA